MYISIITLNYKKSELTIACMRSLYEQFINEFEKNEMELIIVDNASQDKSVELLKDEITKKNYKNIKMIANKENSGFGKGCNIGANLANGNYLLFLNNDTIIKDRSVLEMANYMAEHLDIKILGGQLKNTDGSLQASAGSFYTLPKAIMLLLGMQKLGLLDKSPKDIIKVDWVKGGLFMIRKETFEKLKGFDENIFMYTEDMELCYRAKLEGFDTYFYPKVNIIHAEHGSTNRTFAIVNIYKNILYFYKKHRTHAEYLFLKFILFSKACILILIGNIFRNSYLVKTYRQAIEVI